MGGLMSVVLPLPEPVSRHPAKEASRRADPRAVLREQAKLAKRLKKRKLQLKDCIARLESLLIPDEPA